MREELNSAEYTEYRSEDKLSGRRIYMCRLQRNMLKNTSKNTSKNKSKTNNTKKVQP